MRARQDWHVLNRGVNGERSDQIRARFARDVGESTPDLVVIIDWRERYLSGAAGGGKVQRELAAMLELPARPVARSSPAASCRSIPRRRIRTRACGPSTIGCAEYAARHVRASGTADTRAAVGAAGRYQSAAVLSRTTSTRPPRDTKRWRQRWSRSFPTYIAPPHPPLRTLAKGPVDCCKLPTPAPPPPPIVLPPH